MDQRSHERRSHAGARTSLIHFRRARKDDAESLATLVRWANDESIRHLFRPFASKQQAQRRTNLVDAATRLAAVIEAGRVIYLIELDGELVGEVNFQMNAPQLHEPKGETAWFGLVIGEQHAQGRGIGRLAMEHIEEVARSQGAIWGQIGAFEFNERAHRLYASLGYEEIARIPNITWWNGKRWNGIRMQKVL